MPSSTLCQWRAMWLTKFGAAASAGAKVKRVMEDTFTISITPGNPNRRPFPHGILPGCLLREGLVLCLRQEGDEDEPEKKQARHHRDGGAQFHAGERL